MINMNYQQKKDYLFRPTQIVFQENSLNEKP